MWGLFQLKLYFFLHLVYILVIMSVFILGVFFLFFFEHPMQVNDWAMFILLLSLYN